MQKTENQINRLLSISINTKSIGDMDKSEVYKIINSCRGNYTSNKRAIMESCYIQLILLRENNEFKKDLTKEYNKNKINTADKLANAILAYPLQEKRIIKEVKEILTKEKHKFQTIKTNKL